MRKLLWGAAFVAALAQAEEPCAKLEFAELDSLPKEDLLQMRCDYNRQITDAKLLQAGQWGLTAAQRCSAETVRMDRILARKYALKDKGPDPTIPYYTAVGAMCRK